VLTDVNYHPWRICHVRRARLQDKLRLATRFRVETRTTPSAGRCYVIGDRQRRTTSVRPATTLDCPSEARVVGFPVDGASSVVDSNQSELVVHVDRRGATGRVCTNTVFCSTPSMLSPNRSTTTIMSDRIRACSSLCLTRKRELGAGGVFVPVVFFVAEGRRHGSGCLETAGELRNARPPGASGPGLVRIQVDQP
jgi:uncharacterized metal-binding protein